MDDSHSIRDRFRFKRASAATNNGNAATTKTIRHRTHLHNYGHGLLAGRLSRKSILPFLRGKSLVYALILCVAFVYAVAFVTMQSSITASVWGRGERKWRDGRVLREGLPLGSGLRFVGQRRFVDGEGMSDRARGEGKVGVRPPRIALVSTSLTLFK